jgi:hypothetical protein
MPYLQYIILSPLQGRNSKQSGKEHGNRIALPQAVRNDDSIN